MLSLHQSHLICLASLATVNAPGHSPGNGPNVNNSAEDNPNDVGGRKRKSPFMKIYL